MEENALRYVAGYICKKLKAEEKRHDIKMIIMDVFGSSTGTLEDAESTDQEATSAAVSENWTNLIDRGGLSHINEDTYQLFVCMEKEVRKHFNLGVNDAGNMAVSEGISAERIRNSIEEDPDVKTQWEILTSDHIEVSSETDLIGILKKVISEFVKIRGFAFASSIVETYKKISKKHLQKSKGLRKAIQLAH